MFVERIEGAGRTAEALLHEYRGRAIKIGSFTACSNVTGVFTPYHAMARLMHRTGGVVFVDFAASVPCVNIDMRPADPEERLDAVLWSPHKFLGGPGSSGVLIFNRDLYRNTVPDDSGGGTVNWTNPWGQYSFLDDIEAREDAGTPGFLQTIKAALAVQLKTRMVWRRCASASKPSSSTRWRRYRRFPACACSLPRGGTGSRYSRSTSRGSTTT